MMMKKKMKKKEMMKKKKKMFLPLSRWRSLETHSLGSLEGRGKAVMQSKNTGVRRKLLVPCDYVDFGSLRHYGYN